MLPLKTRYLRTVSTTCSLTETPPSTQRAPHSKSSVHLTILRETSESVDLEVLKAITDLTLALLAHEVIFLRLSLFDVFHNTTIGVAALSLGYVMTNASFMFIWSSKTYQDELSTIVKAMQTIYEIANVPAPEYLMGSRFFRSSYWTIKQQLKIVKVALSQLEGSPFRVKDMCEDNMKRLLECFEKRRQRENTPDIIQCVSVPGPLVPEQSEQRQDSGMYFPDINVHTAKPVIYYLHQLPLVSRSSKNADTLTFLGNTTMNANAPQLMLTAQTIYNTTISVTL
ncbi:hypothetical protein CPB83DRAFT_890750 [Crepidotus variabilis]|uniref:Uncharacterized protein n=1 Tax=Crepidotus variabilis TaxID=179855 RepID=A0A9P6EPY7_9AGAR|nr:hypothetical protein CPB83DRAFT_890750 [Crepidotus variabilis]